MPVGLMFGAITVPYKWPEQILGGMGDQAAAARNQLIFPAQPADNIQLEELGQN